MHLGSLIEGKIYKEPGTLAAAPLSKGSSGSSYQTFKVELVLDPVILQSEHEKSIKQVAEITGESPSSIMNSSLKLSDGETPVYSGKTEVTIKLNSDGLVIKIQRETITIIKGGVSFEKMHKKIEILERQPFFEVGR